MLNSLIAIKTGEEGKKEGGLYKGKEKRGGRKRANPPFSFSNELASRGKRKGKDLAWGEG